MSIPGKASINFTNTRVQIKQNAGTSVLLMVSSDSSSFLSCEESLYVSKFREHISNFLRTLIVASYTGLRVEATSCSSNPGEGGWRPQRCFPRHLFFFFFYKFPPLTTFWLLLNSFNDWGVKKYCKGLFSLKILHFVLPSHFGRQICWVVLNPTQPNIYKL